MDFVAFDSLELVIDVTSSAVILVVQFKIKKY